MRSAVASATAVAALPLGLIGLREHGRIAHARSRGRNAKCRKYGKIRE